MNKTCAELFAGVECTIIGNENEPVSGIAYNSSAVCEGDAFFCIVGAKVDGHTFAQDAINRGARVLVVERKLYLADATDVTEVVVSDSRSAMAIASARFYDNPSDKLQLVGVTGTNGKTTTTYLVQHIVEAAGKNCGVIGTVGTVIGGKVEKSARTTPESPDLQKLFSRMVSANCQVVAMEVSSHALDLKRTYASKFAVTAFSNLTQDHLDYHKTFEDYFEAKARLFSSEYPARRVICIDDAWGQKLLARCSKASDNVITCGFTHQAQIHPQNVEYSLGHTHLTLSVRGEVFEFEFPLTGKFNVENIMCAFGICLQLGMSAQSIVSALEDVPQIPGRLECINAKNTGDISVFVDYAHTPDALEKALGAIKALTKGKTICVFGCGGDRDSSKRPIMGRAALAADQAIVTSDNPRTENPNAIIDDIVAGMVGHEARFSVEADRASAIKLAVSMASANDSILIAGKGHEDYQLVGSKVLSFDDRQVAKQVLEEAFDQTQG